METDLGPLLKSSDEAVRVAADAATISYSAAADDLRQATTIFKQLLSGDDADSIGFSKLVKQSAAIRKRTSAVRDRFEALAGRTARIVAGSKERLAIQKRLYDEAVTALSASLKNDVP